MARKLNQDVWDLWRQRMNGQRASGLSIAAYCRRQGLAKATFHAWKRKLEQVLPAQQGVAATPRSRKGESVSRPSRQPPQVASLPEASARQAGFLRLPIGEVQRSMPWIELTLVDGTLVRIPQNNLAALTTLLSMLRGESLSDASEARHA